MEIQLYDTLTRQHKTLDKQPGDTITLYTCGPTVYGSPHIGNWTTYLRWDFLVRQLESAGYKVKWVMNLTDVGHLVSDEDDGDDKMLKGSEREGISMYDIAQKYIDEFQDDLKKLNIRQPDFMPRATDYIQQQIDIVQELEGKGYVYTTGDGVYMDTTKVADYGKLAKLDIENLRAGARVDMSEKKSPTDFALWKFATDPRRKEMIWDSPWGRGFPGWHLECSAFINDIFEGQTIDVHAGGIDHIPVHHTNEIAQSESLHDGQPLANIWLHGNFLKVDNEKISKSLGNSILLDDIYARGYTPDDFRMFVLQSHYRTEANFTWDGLDAAKNRLNSWRATSVIRYQTLTRTNIESRPRVFVFDSLSIRSDLSTPELLVSIENALSNVGPEVYSDELTQLNMLITNIDAVSGLSLRQIPDISDDAKQLLSQRAEARQSKDFALSDQLRDDLAKMGIGVNDKSGGQIWFYI